MSSIYFYKMTVDSGGAPCVTSDLLSLAICKPMIRSCAIENDLIFGFAANSLHVDNRLIYIALVTQVVRNGEYWTDEYRSRGDCIYERRGSGYHLRRGSLFHTDAGHLEHDLGKPPRYTRVKVLLSDDFRYFGVEGTADYKQNLPILKGTIEALKTGHRRNHAEGVRDALLTLKEQVWSANRKRVLGKPSQQPDGRVCLRGSGCGIIETS
ncbi:hypothetical protein [Metallibacterium scheffleri]|uniref:Nucleotide modification associated domain-containing protein n=1 Tax=Metallibacterium scheffleri TaxID=993689 RepID=A0A4S3KMH9_9GAMM|nr:hypothetical protein [Metallibacterium scheffleri]THD10127.1 hypothetical protein B1806_09675 [Metallibacterium scheffleri]